VNELRKNGMGLAVITYDAVPVLQEFAGRRGITFPLLSDAGSATIKRYGLLNTTVDPGNALFGYPFPGTFVLAPDGTVTARFFERTCEQRNTINSVMVRLGGKVDVPATRVSAPHMRITSYSTDQIASPGTRFSLVLDVEPAEGVHVYAPEVKDYRPVTLKITPQPALLLKDAHYPPSEIYHFKPLDERVPVYQRPFRIVQDVTLDASRDAQAALKGKTEITISGTLDYQACDDKVCFNPQSVPLSWTIAVRPLDRERVKQP
jgi:hypothetical protein